LKLFVAHGPSDGTRNQLADTRCGEGSRQHGSQTRRRLAHTGEHRRTEAGSLLLGTGTKASQRVLRLAQGALKLRDLKGQFGGDRGHGSRVT